MTLLPTTNQLQVMKKHTIEISFPSLLSTTAATKDQTCSRQDTPIPEKKPLVVHFNKQEDKAEIMSVTPENVQKYLEGWGLISLKIKFKD